MRWFGGFIVLVLFLESGVWLVEVQKLKKSLRDDSIHRLQQMENVMRRDIFAFILQPLGQMARLYDEKGSSEEWFPRDSGQGIRKINALLQWMKNNSQYTEMAILDNQCVPLWRVIHREVLFADRVAEGAAKEANCAKYFEQELTHPHNIPVVTQIFSEQQSRRPEWMALLQVRNRLGDRIGVIAIYFPVNLVVQRLAEQFAMGKEVFYVVGRQGEELFAGDMAANGALRTIPWSGEEFVNRYPSVWKKSFLAEHGMFVDEEETFAILTMVDHMSKDIHGSASLLSIHEDNLLLAGFRLAIAYDADELKIPKLRDTLILLFVILFSLGWVGCWNLVKLLEQRRLADEQLRWHARQLEDEQFKLSTIILGTKEGIVATNPQSEVVLVNPAAERLLEKSDARIKQEGLWNVLDDPDYLKAVMEKKRVDVPDTVVYKGKVIQVQAATIDMENGRRAGSSLMLRDITQEKKLEEQLRQMSFTDGLTGLLNRRRIDELLVDEMQRAQRYRLLLGVVLVDIDNFKRFNDEYGHDQGDRVLQSVANALKQGVRNVDVAGRFGGEEFILVLPSTSYPGVGILAERLRRDIEKMRVDGLQVTISMGAAVYPGGSIGQPQELLKACDLALYEAKHCGRNRVCYYREDGRIDDNVNNCWPQVKKKT